MARPCHGPPADRGGAVRRRALWTLVVRGAGVAGLPLPQAALRPAARQADHARGILRAPRRQPGLHTLRLILGVQGLPRGLAERRQRLDLPPPAHRGAADGGIDACVPAGGGPDAARPHAGRAGTPAGTELRLGLHHEDGDDGGVRGEAHEGAPHAVHQPLRAASLRPRGCWLSQRPRREGQSLSRPRLPQFLVAGYFSFRISLSFVCHSPVMLFTFPWSSTSMVTGSLKWRFAVSLQSEALNVLVSPASVLIVTVILPMFSATTSTMCPLMVLAILGAGTMRGPPNTMTPTNVASRLNRLSRFIASSLLHLSLPNSVLR